MKITKSRLKQIIKEEMNEVTALGVKRLKMPPYDKSSLYHEELANMVQNEIYKAEKNLKKKLKESKELQDLGITKLHIDAAALKARQTLSAEWAPNKS